MNKRIATVIVSLACMLGLSACGGLIRVQRAVEAKGYEVEKVGFASQSGQGKTVTVYVEQDLDQAQEQEVVETAKEAYPNAAAWEVAPAEGNSGSSKSNSSSGSNNKPKPNGGAKPNG